MSKGNYCLFILSESTWLSWISTFLNPLSQHISIATYDFKPIKGIKVFPLAASHRQAASWIIKNKFKQVVFLTNQSGLKRDLQIAAILKKNYIRVVHQSATATNIGIDKVKMKHFLTKHGFNTPPYEIALSIDQALIYAKKLGFPLLLKVGKLSEGRKMALVKSDDDIAKYYYENAISEPVILEKFILGKEVSTIVYDNFGQSLVFPVISKPTTDYLFSSSTTRQRIYFAPDSHLKKITSKINQTVLRLAELLNNKLFIGFDMVVDNQGKVYILEFNTRITETIRMSIILTGFNLMENLLLLKRVKISKGSFLASKGFVADLPLPQNLIDQINNKLKINCLAAVTTTRITLFSKDSREIRKTVEEIMNLQQ